MVDARKISFHSFSFAAALFFVSAFLGIGGSAERASAAVPTDPASCVAASGTCELKYNSFGLTSGMSCPAARPTESGTCKSDAQVLPSEVAKDVVKKCCIPAAAAAGGGSCTGAGEICRATVCQSGETSKGACTGGGTCCTSSSSTTAGATQSISFTNPLVFNTVEGLLGSLLGTLQGIIVVLSLVFIVVGAILYITSAGNEGQMTLAKGAITAALIGLAIGIAAPSFLKEISNVLGWTATVDCSGKTGADLTACNAAQETLTAGKSLSAIALSVLNFLLSIVGVLAVIMLVIGGIMYLTSAGDEDRIETGKKIVTYAIVGIVVALAALIIVGQLASFFV